MHLNFTKMSATKIDDRKINGVNAGFGSVCFIK